MRIVPRPKIFSLSIVAVLFFVFFFSTVTLAQTAKRNLLDEARINAFSVANQSGVSTDKTVQGYSGAIIQGALGLVGFAFFILMVYGGFIWLTSRGSEDRVTKGKNIVIAAVIGLVVIVAAYAATWFITQRLIVNG